MLDLALIATIASLLGISAKDLLTEINRTRSTRADTQSRLTEAQRVEHTATIAAKGLLSRILRFYYNDSDLGHHGLRRFSTQRTGLDGLRAMLRKDDWWPLAIKMVDGNESCLLPGAACSRGWPAAFGYTLVADDRGSEY